MSTITSAGPAQPPVALTSRLGVDAALGLANSAHGPSAHYGRRARPGEPAHDHLVTAEAAIEFLGTHAVPIPAEPPSAAQLDRLRAVRARIRELVDGPGIDLGTWRLRFEAVLTDARYRLEADGTVRSVAQGWDGVTDELLAAALTLAAERARLRRCGNPGCRWIFVDRSRKGNRIWCETAVCGNRMRVGRHRLRHLQPARAAVPGMGSPASQPPR